MIEIKPNLEIQPSCPQCESTEIVINSVLIPSGYALIDCTCRRCSFEFYQTLPVGHAVDETWSIGKSHGTLYPLSGRGWFPEALLKAVRTSRKGPVLIKKSVFEKRENVVILNTLDFLYGHSLLKLLNALHHLDCHKDLGLVVVISKAFEWLVPRGCAEVWVVDLTLDDLRYNYVAIQEFVAKECARFQTIYLSKAYSHPDFSEIDITRFTQIKPFNLANFILEPPTITFVMREDRWWFGNVLDYWYYRICRKLGMLQAGRRALVGRQNALIKKTIEAIRKVLPGAHFNLVGLGKTGNFNAVNDLRRMHPDPASEIAWCRTYARSHVVVGVHGSNMLLPTAFAAGCVEILPRERYGNMVQDISVRYADRRQLFFYRFAEQYSGPKSIAGKVVAMIEDYEVYEKNMCRNIYTGVKKLSPWLSQADIYAANG